MTALAFSLLLCGAGFARAADLGLQARSALEKATAYLQSIATNGGYVGIYSLDLQQRYGESLYESARPGEIWVQPPGTPSVGKVFLRAYRATGDERYLTAARAAGFALAWGQRRTGGWDHRVDVSALIAEAPPPRPDGRCTLDDRITQGVLSFLMDLDDAVDEDWLTEAVDLGLHFMLASQYENGGWPQWYPLRGGYHDHHTFNDNTINDCIAVLLEAHRRYGRKEHLQGARRGGDFIILSQRPPPQAGWAQQYDQDLQPAWARKFEPPAICSAVTARNIRTLVDLYKYTGDDKYLQPIPAAITWLENAQLEPDLWARLYEVGSNRPIYGDRDGQIHYDYYELSEERRKGYAWRGSFGVARALQRYHQAKAVSAESALDAQPASTGPAPSLVARIEEIIQSQDAQGRWVGEKLYIRDFVRNMNALCAYLEQLNPN